LSATRRRSWVGPLVGALVSGRSVGVAAAAGTSTADAPHPVVVLGEGPDAEELASRLAGRLDTPYVRHDSAPFRALLSLSRAPSFAAALKDRAKDGKLIARVRAAARGARVDAVVLVEVRKGKHGVLTHLWLIDAQGAGGAAVDRDVALDASASLPEETDAAWGVLGAHLPSRASLEPPVAAAPTKPAPEVTESVPAPPPSPPPPAALAPPLTIEEHPAPQGPSSPARAGTRSTALAIVGARIEAGARHFSYIDRLTATLRPYDLGAAPLASVNAELYPLARTSVPGLRGFGLTFDYALAFALTSTDSAGTSVSTGWSSFDLGARERIPLGRSVTLGLGGGYGEIIYSFKGALSPTAELPDVHYRFIEGGVDASVSVAGFDFYGAGSYLGVLATGIFATYFPRAMVGGVQGRLGVGRALSHGFEVLLEASYTRFFYTLNPQPGDPYVAGGALDEIARGSLGVAYAF
jgi:hypothetical protein